MPSFSILFNTYNTVRIVTRRFVLSESLFSSSSFDNYDKISKTKSSQPKAIEVLFTKILQPASFDDVRRNRFDDGKMWNPDPEPLPDRIANSSFSHDRHLLMIVIFCLSWLSICKCWLASAEHSVPKNATLAVEHHHQQHQSRGLRAHEYSTLMIISIDAAPSHNENSYR